jgi:aryl-alcohol dehydrogenase-like predicted oxidoreductase
MKKRILGKTGFEVTELGLGTWQVGGTWGQKFSQSNAEIILRKAIESGINFIDTADVYSNGESEKAIGKVIKEYNHKIYVATKCGRRISPHIDSNYTPQVLRNHVEDSLRNMNIECIDLIQLHCPPNDTYYRPEIFQLFEDLKQEGKIQYLGVSVEKVEQAIKTMQYANVTTVQIIFNMFRQRPSELFFELAKKNNIGIIARVPLASGMLSGNYNKDTKFEIGDHRLENRNGEHFDKGETFSGIDYEIGIKAVEELKSYFGNKSLPLIALNWILHFNEVSTVIPGASKLEHLNINLNYKQEENISKADINFIKSIYEKYIKQSVHEVW